MKTEVTVSWQCSKCRKYVKAEIPPSGPPKCPRCGTPKDAAPAK
jgi:NAD-dependent SIR2 family protein deacetylase